MRSYEVWEYWGEVGGQKCENMLGIMYFWDSLKDVSTWTVPQWIITVDDVSDFLANKPVWIYPSPTHQEKTKMVGVLVTVT
jgi:hypothetical protein